MRRCLWSFLLLALLGSCSAEVSLSDGFDNPPDEYKPWCYWWWLNGNVDEPTITADLESMKSLGFGGFLLIDSRGYWDDDEHVRIPEPAMEFMSGEWLDKVAFSIREAKRLGLEVALNPSCSGGTFKGPWLQRKNSPKKLIRRFESLASGPNRLLPPDSADFEDVACYAVRFEGPAPEPNGAWADAGDGAAEMVWHIAPAETSEGTAPQPQAAEWVRLQPGNGVLSWEEKEGNWLLLRFGTIPMPGHEYDVDILDPDAVKRHLCRVLDPLKERVGEAFGTTLTHLYSVSWEGAVPNWSEGFEAGFSALNGYSLSEKLPVLAGIRDRSDSQDFLKDFRETRNRLFLNNFYGVMRETCHAYGLKLFSESGGPWKREPALLEDADQMEFLAMNDMPQGEFWYREDGKEYYLTRPIAAAAHAYGLKRASAEAFTDMILHWSECPADLKPFADQAFLDGINHLVWHTFTCSPERFGVPGSEYFAGTHINRNVTWQTEAAPFIHYLSRCQFLLQQGRPVADFVLVGGHNIYQHWGHHREYPRDGSSLTIPHGFNYDLVNEAVLLKRLEARNGRAVLPDGTSYSAVVVDEGSCLDDAADRKLSELERRGVKVIRGTSLEDCGLLPDFEGPFFCAHRRMKGTDIYFVAGEGAGDMVFRATGDVQVWDAVSGERTTPPCTKTSDGRTGVHLELPASGSAFVLFNPGCPVSETIPQGEGPSLTAPGPWSVSFRYHKLSATPPSPREWTELHDLTADPDPDVRWFSGTVCLATTLSLSSREAGASLLSLGEVKKGLVRVFVNGNDCGVCWTAPWTINVAGLLKEGENRIDLHFTNTWSNRLIGDCMLPAEERVTTSNLQYHSGTRGRWLPTRYSGYAAGDELIPSGLLGPVRLIGYRD